jgi:GDP-mannose 6-dehydrogenase
MVAEVAAESMGVGARDLRVAVFGLGYVGCVSAACFADRGHAVFGVDVNPEKVALLAAAKPTVVEERIGELVGEGVASGRLRATTDAAAAIGETDIALVCVGTPSRPNGSLATEHLERVVSEIGAALATLGRRYTVVIRSTMLPGTCEGVLVPLLEEASGLVAGRDFGVAVNPEFLREGTSVKDFYSPPKTVIGELDEASGDAVAALYEGLPGPVHRVPIRVAELTKYVDNSFHALKVAYANEIGAICKQIGLDSHTVMDIFLADTKLNISPAYLRPGFAFGGSCLPKDIRALSHFAGRHDLRLPVLEHILPSNEEHLRRVYDLVVGFGKRRIGLLGLAFKSGTDDLRESPMVELAERLLGRGFELLIHDSQVALSQLAGANRAYIDERIPHLSKLMAPTAASVIEASEVCILATNDADVRAALRDAGDRIVVELVRDTQAEQADGTPRFIGVAW